MHSNNISENRELKGDKVENHDISLSHTFCEKEERISFYFSKGKNVFLFLWIEKNLSISFVETIRVDNVL